MKKDFIPITKSKAFSTIKKKTIPFDFSDSLNNIRLELRVTEILDSVRDIIYFEKKSWFSKAVWASLPEKDLFGPAEVVAEQIAQLRFANLLLNGDL